MKKFIALIFALLIFIAIAVFVTKSSEQTTNTDYLRIHIRANSNSDEDQNVKYEVKQLVVNFLAPYIKECITKERAIEVMNNLLTDVEKVCDEGLTARGFNYGSRASIRQEKFPTRVYGDLTLEEGIYDALIIELGTGEGDNWWCVIYPPLCFTSADTTIEYRSAIWEIIKKWQNK